MNFLIRFILQESVVFGYSMFNTQNNNSAKLSWRKSKLPVNHRINSRNSDSLIGREFLSIFLVDDFRGCFVDSREENKKIR